MPGASARRVGSRPQKPAQDLLHGGLGIRFQIDAGVVLHSSCSVPATERAKLLAGKPSRAQRQDILLCSAINALEGSMDPLRDTIETLYVDLRDSHGRWHCEQMGPSRAGCNSQCPAPP